MYSLLLGNSNSYGTKRPKPYQRNISVPQPLGTQSTQTPLEGFFSKCPKFRLQPLNSPVYEFDRLCKLYGWEKGGPEREFARIAFHIAMKKEFDGLYGLDEHDIKNWHKLCRVLRITPVPDTLRECRAVSCRSSDPLCPWGTKVSSFIQAVVKKHVNLVDLVHGSKVEVQDFKTEKELSEYTQETEKYFPKEDAKDGGVLRALRRHILAPREGTRSSRKNKSHKGLRK
jgi:hypothetical protein